MRINNVGPLIVTPTEPRTEVATTRAVDPVRAYSPGEASPEPPMPIPTREEAPAPAPEGERRQRSERRGEDRRKRQIPVLIDTRVGDRRAAGRRTEDEAQPVRIDVEV